MILLLIIPLLWVLFKTKNNKIRVAIVMLFIVWFGVPTFNKWRADKLVDELCAKNGGIKVYETVTLPKQSFNQWGKFEVWDKRYISPNDKRFNDEYFIKYETQTLKGDNDYGSLLPRVIKDTSTIFRAKGNKKMGELITYVRGSGEPFLLMLSTSHRCPADSDLEAKIFLKDNQ